MQHKLLLGIQHLMTGAQVCAKDLDAKDVVLTFQRESASIVAVLSPVPIQAYWRAKQCWIESVEVADNKLATYSEGEAEWWAQVVAPKMQECEQRSYDMQVWSRRGNEYGDSRYAPNEPSRFPEAVVTAMRRKHGAESDKYLAELHWNRDHWYYNYARMYVGVEPDGYIHT